MAAATRQDTGGPPVIARPGLFHARMAGVSGVVFAVLFAVGLVLLQQAPDLEASDAEYVAFYTSGSGDVLVALGLYIVPFAGIACLWHMIATRTLLQVLRPGSWSQIPHWLHLAAGHSMVFVYGVRAAGVYMITTTGLARLAGVLPRWLAGASYVVAAFLLVSVTFHPAILLVFPAWVLMMSVLLLVHRPIGETP